MAGVAITTASTAKAKRSLSRFTLFSDDRGDAKRRALQPIVGHDKGYLSYAVK
jgi:hypothetical protein